VADQFEAMIVQQGRNVVSRACEEVVQADDFIARVNQSLAQVRPYEPGAARDQYPQGGSSTVRLGLVNSVEIIGAMLLTRISAHGRPEIGYLLY
jgi:hypothetical protein